MPERRGLFRSVAWFAQVQRVQWFVRLASRGVACGCPGVDALKAGERLGPSGRAATALYAPATARGVRSTGPPKRPGPARYDRWAAGAGGRGQRAGLRHRGQWRGQGWSRFADGIARMRRAMGDRAPADPCVPCAVSQCPWRAIRMFGGNELRQGEAPLGESGPAAFVCSEEQRRPAFTKLRWVPPPVPVATKTIRMPLGTLRGRLRERWIGRLGLRPIPGSKGMGRARARPMRLVCLLGRWSRPRRDARTLQVRWVFCQENNVILSIPEVLYRCSCQKGSEKPLAARMNHRME